MSNKLIRLCALAFVFLLGGQSSMEPDYKLPSGALYVGADSFLANRDVGGDVRVYHVQGLVVVDKLLPVKVPSVPGMVLGFIVSSDVAASAQPRMFYLTDLFERKFRSFDDAAIAIEKSELGGVIKNVCVDPVLFTAQSSRVHTRQQERRP